MELFETVRMLKAQRNDILAKHLPAEALSQFFALEDTIKTLDHMIGMKFFIASPRGRKQGGESPATDLMDTLPIDIFSGNETLPEGPRGARIPLSQRKAELIRLLETAGPLTRSEILSRTKIPAGSLSNVLNEGGFEQAGNGKWRLKDSRANGQLAVVD